MPATLAAPPKARSPQSPAGRTSPADRRPAGRAPKPAGSAAALSLAELVAADLSDPTAPAVSPADLSVCPAFEPLSDSQRREFLGLAGRHRFAAGETILHEGRETRCLWFILSGSCEVVKAAPDGGERVLAALEAGALFGEMSFFSPAPHSASVRATTDCVVLRMNRENWVKLEQIGLRPAFMIARQTAAVMSDRLRRMDEWVTRALADTPDPRARAVRADEWDDFRSKLFGG